MQPKCNELSRLVKLSGTTSVRFRTQTPGTLVLGRRPLPHQRLDPHHPIDNDGLAGKGPHWARDPAFSIAAVPMGLLARPGTTPHKNGEIDVRHRPYLDLPFDPWFDRVARARAAGGTGLIAPMIPVDPRPGKVSMSLQLRPLGPFPKTQRSRVGRRFKAAVSLIVVRGARVEEIGEKKKIVFDANPSPENWILPGWTYTLQWKAEMYHLSWADLIQHIRPMLLKLHADGTRSENRWAKITARMPIPMPVQTISRPESERAPDLDFDPFHSEPIPPPPPRPVVDDGLARIVHTHATQEPAAPTRPSLRSPLPRQPRTDGDQEQPQPPRLQHWTKGDAPVRRKPGARFGLLDADPNGSRPPASIYEALGRLSPVGPSTPQSSADPAPEVAEVGTEELRKSIFSALNLRFSKSGPFDTLLAASAVDEARDVEEKTAFDDEEDNEEDLDALGFVISQEMKDAWDRAEPGSRSSLDSQFGINEAEDGHQLDRDEDDIDAVVDQGKQKTSPRSGGRASGRQARLRGATRWRARAEVRSKPTNEDEFGFPLPSADEEEAVASRLAAASRNKAFASWDASPPLPGKARSKKKENEGGWRAAGSEKVAQTKPRQASVSEDKPPSSPPKASKASIEEKPLAATSGPEQMNRLQSMLFRKPSLPSGRTGVDRGR
uniref:Uncharacterized protein n=1 Tax=Mycena chlorophos TaxID=658473 RepID=A0ABQ0L447_MYCCL|nr:predicted protein [Mycena chlorophos]